MSALQGELELRAHDLPVSWDGAPVTWGEWEPGIEARGRVFICPPPKVPGHCSRCGSIEVPLRNRGLVPSADVDHLVLRLLVNRCPDCRFDVVWDLEGDDWWDLGPEDYGDGGSVPPAAAPSSEVANREPGAGSAAAIARARAAVAEARTKPDGLF